MQRRSFLQLLAAVPLIGWIVPKRDCDIVNEPIVAITAKPKEESLGLVQIWIQGEKSYLYTQTEAGESVITECPVCPWSSLTFV